MQRSVVALCGAVFTMLCLAACGGGGSSYDNPNSPTPPPTNNPNPPASAAQISILGERGAQSFTPNPASVGQGQTMTFKNNDNQLHHIVANDGSWDTGNIAAGATSPAVTLRTDGTNYHCANHPSMIGSINASAGAPPPCEGQYCSSTQ